MHSNNSKSRIRLKIARPGFGFRIERAERGVLVKGSVIQAPPTQAASYIWPEAHERKDAHYRLELHIGKRVIYCQLEACPTSVGLYTFRFRFSSKPGFKWLCFKLFDPEDRPVHRVRRLIYVPRNRDIGAVEVPSSAESLPFGVNLVGIFRYELGLAEAGRLTAHALHASTVPHALIEAPFNPNCIDDNNELEARYTSGLPYQINLFHFNAPEMIYVRTHWPRVYKNGQYNIGHWAWELPRLPKHWIKEARGLHEVWTCSEFVRSAVAADLHIPAHVVHYPIRLHTPDARGLPAFPKDLTKVLFAFDFNSYTARKNPEAALRAFEIAAAQDPRMHLILKVHNADRHPEAARQLIQRVRSLPSVSLIVDTLSRAQMSALQATADVFLSLHRAEGFGLNIAECMALGKPVIVTAWSGNMDFTNADNAYLVPFKLIEIEQRAGDYEVGQVWADPDVDVAAEHLLSILRNPAEARARGERARACILQQYSLETTASEIKRHLNRIRTEQGF